MKLLLSFPSNLHEIPYTAEVILETNTKMNIDRANVDAVRAELIVDVPDEKAEEIIGIFRKKDVEVKKLMKLITWDEESCIHCGACISVCPTGVFKFTSSWNISLEEEKCIRCDVCLKACPICALACVE